MDGGHPPRGPAATLHAVTRQECREASPITSTESCVRTVRFAGSRRGFFPIRDVDGRVVRIAGVAADITERKLAADELQERDRRFSDLLGNVELVSMMLDTKARITYCNDYLLQLTGWRREEVLGQDWFEIFVPSEAHDVESRVFLSNRRVARGKASRERDPHALGRAAPHSLEQFAAALGSRRGHRNGKHRRRYHRARRYQESLRQNEERTRLIFESVGEGIHGIDLSGTIIFENSAAAKLLGYSIEGLIGKPAHATMHHSRKDGIPHPIADCAIHTTMYDGTAAGWRTKYLAQRRFSFPVEYTTAPIRNDRNEITGAVVAFRDITHRMEAQNRIRRLNRVYAMLSGINTLIVRVRDREALFREACRIAVEAGAFKMAWIGVIDPQTLDGKIVAWHGGEEGYVEQIRLTAREGTPDSERPACRALRQSQPVICNDIATDASLSELRDELLETRASVARMFSADRWQDGRWR